MNFAEALQAITDDYNLGSANIDAFFQELLSFGQDLDAEGQRAAREGLSEEELAVFDLVTQGGDLVRKDEAAVKAMAQHLMQKLKGSALVIDWRKKQQTRARVKKTIRDELRTLGAANEELNTLLGSLYAHVYEAYTDGQHHLYVDHKA